MVTGIEGDFDWDQHGRTTLNAPVAGLSGSFENKVDWLATVRGRLGYASGGALWYVTGGWADTKRELNASASVTGLAGGAVSASQTKSGWTVGGGVETKLWNSNWSAKLEYLHVDLGTDTVNFNTFTTAAPIVPVTSHTATAKVRDEIVRVGLNYEFW